ncbi:MAG: phage tail protein [Acidimicrobiales bacterium]
MAGSELFAEQGAHAGKFVLEIDDRPIGWFTEVSGLEVEVEVETIEEGGENSFVHKVPGRMKWPDLVFKRGLTQSDNLFEWLDGSAGAGLEAAGNTLKRSTGAITLLSRAGKALRAWEIEGAFPVKWTGPTFASGSDDTADEELRVAHHGFRPKTLG